MWCRRLCNLEHNVIFHKALHMHIPKVFMWIKSVISCKVKCHLSRLARWHLLMYTRPPSCSEVRFDYAVPVVIYYCPGLGLPSLKLRMKNDQSKSINRDKPKTSPQHRTKRFHTNVSFTSVVCHCFLYLAKWHLDKRINRYCKKKISLAPSIYFSIKFQFLNFLRQCVNFSVNFEDID